jgi:endonuclease-3 related protein
MNILEIYKKLLGHFGSQNWWPVSSGFEPENWEIMAGAVLAQNTGWKNVEKTLENLKKNDIVSPEKILKTGKKHLEQIIKPSGFYRQKTLRLKDISRFVINKNYNFTREELLKVKGVGPETADSILLYAFGKMHFVVDAYTRRVFSRLGIMGEKSRYDDIKGFFEKNLPANLSLYKEFHALIVELAKKYCKKKPECGGCPLNEECVFVKGAVQ